MARRNGEEIAYTMGSKKTSQAAAQKTRSAHSEKARSETSHAGS